MLTLEDGDLAKRVLSPDTPLVPSQPSTFERAVLCFAIFIKGGLLGAYLPFYTLWLSKKGYSNTELGLISVVDAVFCLFLPLVGGALDKLRSHNLGFVFLLVILATLKLLYLVVWRSFFWILVLTALTAPLIRAANSLLDCLALYAVDRGDFPRVRLVGDLGWGSITLLVGAMIDITGDVDVVFIIFASASGILAVVWMASMPFLRSIRKDSEPMGLNEFLVHLRRLCGLLDFELVQALVMLCAGGAGVGLIANFELVLMKKLGSPGYLMGLSKTVATSMSVPVWWFATRALDRWGIYRVQLVALTAMTIRLAILGSLTSPWQVPLSEMFAGLGGFSLLYSSITVYTSRKIDEDLKSTSQALIFVIFAGLGAGVSPLLGGMYSDKMGLRKMFFHSAMLLATLVICLLIRDATTAVLRMARKS